MNDSSSPPTESLPFQVSESASSDVTSPVQAAQVTMAASDAPGAAVVPVPATAIPAPKGKAARTVYHAVLFQSGMRNDQHGFLSRSSVQHLERRLEKEIKTPPQETEIDLWLDSLGGDANAAYKLWLILRGKCCWLRAIVPDVAKSAATLLALGADEILMTDGADLGPLDAQIEHPSREGVSVSAIDVAKSLDYLGTTAVSLGLRAVGSTLIVTELPRADVLSAALPFTAQLLQPAIDKLDPSLLHRASQQLKVAERYATTMLEGRAVSAPKSFNAEKLAKNLVNNYPTHSFVISKKEAANLDLPIGDATKHPRWGIIQAFHREFWDVRQASGDVNSSGPYSRVFVLPDSDLDTNNASITPKAETDHGCHTK